MSGPLPNPNASAEAGGSGARRCTYAGAAAGPRNAPAGPTDEDGAATGDSGPRACPPCGAILAQKGPKHARTCLNAWKWPWSSSNATELKQELYNSQRVVQQVRADNTRLDQQVQGLQARAQSAEAKVTSLGRQLEGAIKEGASLRHQLEEHEFKQYELKQHNQQLQAQCVGLKERVEYQDNEVELLEERLSHAHQQVERAEQQLEELKVAPGAAPDTPADPHPSTILSGFEIGFGVVEQSQLLNNMAMHAEALAAALVATWERHVDFLSEYASQSLAAWVQAGRAASQAVLQQALMQAAWAWALGLEAVVLPEAWLQLSALAQQVAPHQGQQGITSAVQHLRCQVSRSHYLAGMQPTGMVQQVTPSEARVQAVRNSLVYYLTQALHLDNNQQAQLGHHLLALASATVQLLLLCWSLDSSAPGLEVVCSPHAGEEWDATTMEPAVKEVPVQGLTRPVVLACVRPSLQVNPPAPSSTSGATAPLVLVKAQVHCLVRAPPLAPPPAAAAPVPPTHGVHTPTPPASAAVAAASGQQGAKDYPSHALGHQPQQVGHAAQQLQPLHAGTPQDQPGGQAQDPPQPPWKGVLNTVTPGTPVPDAPVTAAREPASQQRLIMSHPLPEATHSSAPQAHAVEAAATAAATAAVIATATATAAAAAAVLGAARGSEEAMVAAPATHLPNVTATAAGAAAGAPAVVASVAGALQQLAAAAASPAEAVGGAAGHPGCPTQEEAAAPASGPCPAGDAPDDDEADHSMDSSWSDVSEEVEE